MQQKLVDRLKKGTCLGRFFCDEETGMETLLVEVQMTQKDAIAEQQLLAALLVLSSQIIFCSGSDTTLDSLLQLAVPFVLTAIDTLGLQHMT